MQNYPLISNAAKTKTVDDKRHYGASLRDWPRRLNMRFMKVTKIILCERGVTVPHTHRDSSRFLLDLQVVPAAKRDNALTNSCGSIPCYFLATMGSTNVVEVVLARTV